MTEHSTDVQLVVSGQDPLAEWAAAVWEQLQPVIDATNELFEGLLDVFGSDGLAVMVRHLERATIEHEAARWAPVGNVVASQRRRRHR